MSDFQLPQYDELPNDILNQIMLTRSDASDEAKIEQLLRRVFIFAALTKSSDVHLEGRRDPREPDVYLHIRTPHGLENFTYPREKGGSRHFMHRLLELCGVASGGSTPPILSTRFEYDLPADLTAQYKLPPPPNGEDYHIDVRVEFKKTFDGFAFICRILDPQRAPRLYDMGLPYALLQAILAGISEPSGLFLVSGPTGSGKTTFLNALLGERNNGLTAIETIENPVEYRLRGKGPIKQMQVQGDITFANALRSTVRSDPDIIMVGEIRDPETMDIAMHAAQTGHLVFGTLHANSATETVSRAMDLTDRSRDAYRFADVLKMVVAIRLLDRYEGTPVAQDLSRRDRDWLSNNGVPIYDGFKEVPVDSRAGKVPIIEAFHVDSDIQDVICQPQLVIDEIYRYASEQLQYETLPMAGFRAVQAGLVRLNDCRTALGGRRVAQSKPGLRARLAKEFDLTLPALSQSIDEFCHAQEHDHHLSLNDFLKRMRP